MSPNPEQQEDTGLQFQEEGTVCVPERGPGAKAERVRERAVRGRTLRSKAGPRPQAPSCSARPRGGSPAPGWRAESRPPPEVAA